MSAFTGLFLGGIAWGGLWHFSAYLIEAAIKRPLWVYIVKLITGVVITYPFVEANIIKAARLSGFDEPQIKRLRVCVFTGYFCAFTAGGIGKGCGTAVDPIPH